MQSKITKHLQPVHILLVEDNEGDIVLTTEAFEEATMNTTLSIAKDGKEAIDFLNKESGHQRSDTPDFILLDINLPKKSGHEVLRYIKGSPHLKRIPVIMLTTSSSEKDITTCYENYVNCYITKPVDAHRFLDVVSTIENFWISVVKLPAKRS